MTSGVDLRWSQCLFLSWYYVVVVISLICVLAILFCPNARVLAATSLAVFWSTAYWPVDYKEWDVRRFTAKTASR